MWLCEGEASLCVGEERAMAPQSSIEEEKAAIFQLAATPNHCQDIQTTLQTMDFNVNEDSDVRGDFLLHILCRTGQSQLPLVTSLVKLYGADVELCNSAGMTSLMVAASAGDPVLCDVLVCLLGAKVNSVNPSTGQSALHYAVRANHASTVQCLIRRGADVNQEDFSGRRPDDLPLTPGLNEECLHLIHGHRSSRMESLSALIQNGELRRRQLLKSDLSVVSDGGYTLLMTATVCNRPAALEVLLQTTQCTLDAQHPKCGMTSLSIAAQMGHVEALTVLLTHGAKANIPDMKGYLPLHHAVRNKQERVIDVMMQFFPQCYTEVRKASRICRSSSIQNRLQAAMTTRQKELVTPKLMTYAVTGDANQLYQLLEDGDDVNVETETGTWPLYLAVENGHVDVVKLLLETGGDVCRQHCRTGETILHLSARLGNREMLQPLLTFCRQACPLRTSACPVLASFCTGQNMLDINVTDHYGRTPLQLAAQRGFSQVVALLLSYGATTALLDGQGQLITCPQYDGVRMLLQLHRQQHTEEVISLVKKNSKRALQQLQRVWVEAVMTCVQPRFDHNLRSRQGDTPLMEACFHGNLRVVRFLLESAVYEGQVKGDVSDEDQDSDDADSGVLNPSAGSLSPPQPAVQTSDGEESQSSGELSQSTDSITGRNLFSSADHTSFLQHRPMADTGLQDTDDVHRLSQSMEEAGHMCRPAVKTRVSHPVVNTYHLLKSVVNGHYPLTTLLQDASRPKGLSIFHEGVVSHVCALSQRDGSTALHRAVEGGDNLQVVRELLKAECGCLNMQNDAGLSPLHLACRLGRKIVVRLLLNTKGIDLELRTLECQLPEEMTSNKSFIRMVHSARSTLPAWRPAGSGNKMAACQWGASVHSHKPSACCQEFCPAARKQLEMT